MSRPYLSNRQKYVIKCMKSGFILKFQNRFSSTWWLSNVGNNQYHPSVDVSKKTAGILIDAGMIEHDKTDKWDHKHYKLTDAGQMVNTDNIPMKFVDEEIEEI